MVKYRFAFSLLPAAAALVIATTIPASADTVVGRPTISGPNWPADYQGVVPGPFDTSTPIDLTLSPGTGETPVEYHYEVNGQATVTVRATVGTAQISITPTGRVGTLKVTAVAADGSQSDTVSEQFFAESVPPAANQDINGDGVPDLVTVGGTPGLASGLWLARGVKDRTAGRVSTPASDIGALGAGFGSGPDPADFDGGQVVVGDYFGDGFQDFLVYYPSGLRNGVAALLGGSGDGTVVYPYSGNQKNVYLADYNNDNPVQFANAYDSRHVDGSGDDLIAISGDADNGYYLDYYANRSFGMLDAAPQFFIHTNTPDGTPDWQNWKMTTTRLASGTAMYLWKPSTGDLYLWEKVGIHDNGDSTGTIEYTQYKIAGGWNTGATLSTFQAAVFGDSGTPGLWTVTPEGAAIAYTVTDLSPTGTARIHAGAAQPLTQAH
ncbi:VCBS repeat-containing protein [Actinoallomurus rhizosphaericola]|uniref:VCBS repeat-containing protein n=1 Tax=Actinoallomurus rhizosphaericola TaxID=2952536 RepID=UPI00209280C1|nr:VCBS repeat-containing protein [Actinoallomurus rhizosphaericola]MCO5999628.1 VCBS repeat-containing protein [Actinoallomurus rhizosphaericola]